MVDLAKAQRDNTISTSSGHKNIFRGLSIPHLFTPPALFVLESLNDDQKEELLTMGLQEDPAAKGHFNGAPSTYDFSKVLALNPRNPNRPRAGLVSIEGYFAYLTLIRGAIIYQYFSRCSSNTNTSHLVYQRDQDVDLETESEITYRSHVTLNDTELDIGTLAQPGYHFFQGMLRPIAGPQDATQQIEYRFNRALDGYEKGIFFPYFDGLVAQDKDFAAHVFLRFFYRGLSDSAKGAAGQWEKMRPGIRNISFTRAGKALSHMYLGIEMSANAGVEINFIIENGVYHGFLLKGDNFCVYYRGQEILPVDKKTLISELERVDLHSRRLAELCTVFNAVTRADGTPYYHVEKNQIESSRGLLNKWLEMDPTNFSEEAMNSIRSKIDDLEYGDTFADVNLSNITSFLQYVDTGDQSKLASFPAYLGGHFFENRDRVSVGLGIFGPRAPTISPGSNGDQLFNIPKDLDREDPNLKVGTDKKRPLPFLPVHSVLIRDALGQWNKVFSLGQIRVLPPKKKQTGFTDMSKLAIKGGIGGNNFMPTYQLIKRISSRTRAGEVPAGTKRKIGQDNAEAGSSKRVRVDYSSFSADV
jgi:hypothetical protein